MTERFQSLPQEIVDMTDALTNGKPNPHPELGELTILDPQADPPGLSNEDTEIKTVKSPGITTVKSETSGIRTVKTPKIQTVPPIRTVKSE